MALKLVYEPIKIGNVEIPNRVVRSAHGTCLAEGGLIGDRLIDYHVARAKGGVGLSILEAGSVHPSSVLDLALFDDRITAGHRKLMTAVAPYGMRIFQQIWHSGHAYPAYNGAPPWGPTALPNPTTGLVSNPMGMQEIAEIIQCFAAAAKRVQAGGVDGVEIHAAHGYLIMQFLSPLSNRRTDQYGGSLENRMRLLREILGSVRASVGPDYPVGVRMSASLAEGGIREAELAEVITRLEKDGLIDYLNASYSDYYDFKLVSAMDQPAGYQLPSSGILTAAAKRIPRIVIGRFRTLEEAEGVLRDGIADMVAMTRAHIADPDIVRKTKAGHPELVRSCIGCNQGCWNLTNYGFPLSCTINPAAGNEGRFAEELIRKVSVPKKVLIAGGGPAGMEAARVAALAGHSVHLVEAQAVLGGQVAVAKRAPYLHAIGDIAHWLEQEVYRLGVQVELSTYIDAEAILAANPDFVIVATGAYPRNDGIQYQRPNAPTPGAEMDHVISGVELLTGSRKSFGTSAVVYDEVGHYEGIAAAEFLLSMGVSVTFVTRFERVAPQMDWLTRVNPALKRFAKLGDFRLMLCSQIAEIGVGRCGVQSLHRANAEIVSADIVVFLTAKAPLRTLYDELREKGFQHGRNIAIVGDACAPRDLQLAIAEGHHAARAIQ
jgi:2,4-dienoyl-CoA reductase-like NADH-dependent reductase (Old Yellow Enzyme family)/thioredoxin reductase